MKKSFNTGRASLAEKIVKTIVFVIFVIYALSLLYPFLWAFNASLKDQIEFVQDKVSITQSWKFDNYVTAFVNLEVQDTNMFGMVLNSIFFTFGQTFFSLFFTATLAYAVAKYKFPGYKLISFLALIVVMLPIVGALPASYKVYDALHLLNSRLYIVAAIGGCIGYNFIILTSCFNGLSNTYMEAAMIDGAGHFTVFFKIMLPMVISPIIALSVMAFIGCWNDYMGPWLYYPELPTLASGLYVYSSQATHSANIPLSYAGMFVSMIPVLILFFIFQNKIFSLSLGGGIKG